MPASTQKAEAAPMAKVATATSPAAATLPAWFHASLRPCWCGKRSLPTTPSVNAVRAGPINAPPSDAAICAAATVPKPRAGSVAIEPATTASAATATHRRGRSTRSTSRPAGPLNTSPARPLIVMTSPIRSGFQPTVANQVARNGPSPEWTSARKKFSAASPAVGGMVRRNTIG